MTGLDQDMMQRNLSCKNYRDSQKNIITSGISQFFINLLFLMLGVLLYIFAQREGITATGDKLFPTIATSHYFPSIVGILFIVGLISSAYSAAGSALTALTTSFTVDILGAKDQEEQKLAKTRKKVHVGMAIVMAIVIYIFNLLNNTSVIDAVYILASYTYGPILGLFAFGIFTKFQVKDRYIPILAIISPILCYILQTNSESWFSGYKFSYELLIFNALFTFIGLSLLIKRKH
jgi:Na+/proline symporter